MPELQWGRSLGSCGNVPRPSLSAHALQWGRSLGSCGNRATVLHCRSQIASMGPQPWELRKLTCHSVAAWATLQWGRSLGSCGNVVRLGTQRRCPLQWGRSLGSCGNRRLLRLQWPDTLQWGRSLGSCGNVRMGTLIARHTLLQWGRSLGSCGNPIDWQQLSSHPCFNGAAALGAAETRLNAHSTQSIVTLQWGRSLGSCGNALYVPGPRDELQWGRSLGSCGNACRGRIRAATSHGFDGAAALGAAETTAESPACYDRVASMGPQPWELRKQLQGSEDLR